MRSASLCALLAMFGCANTMNGEVEGEKVGGADDAIFQLEALASLNTGALVITGASDACEYLDRVEGLGGDCEDYCEELQPIARDHLPNGDLWTLTIWFMGLEGVERSYGHGGWADLDGFGAIIDRSNVEHWRDAEECTQACQADDMFGDGNTESSSGGTLTITSYETREILEGEYTIEFGSDLVEGHFSADWCDLVELN